MPVLQEVLGILDLVLGTADGDNAVLRSLQGLINLDGGPGLMADLLDPLASLTDDGACHLNAGHRGGTEGGTIISYKA